jgi:hypothetical protein
MSYGLDWCEFVADDVEEISISDEKFGYTDVTWACSTFDEGKIDIGLGLE